MKISDVSQKTIDFFKKNGKNIACVTITSAMLALPSMVKSESNKKEKNFSTSKVEQTVVDERYDDYAPEPSISMVINGKTIHIDSNIDDIDGMLEEMKNVLMSEELVEKKVYSDGKIKVTSYWQKSKNYDEENNHREYERTVYIFTPKDENYLESYKDDYSKLVKALIDNQDEGMYEKYLESKEVLTVTPEEEIILNTSNYLVELLDTDIKFVISNSKLNNNIREFANITLKIVTVGLCVLFVLGIVDLGKEIKNWM